MSSFWNIWNIFGTRKTQKILIFSSKVPISESAYFLEHLEQGIYVIDYQIFILFQNCSKVVPSVPNVPCSKKRGTSQIQDFCTLPKKAVQF